MTVEFHKNQILIGMLHTFNPSIWEAEVGESLQVQGQPVLHSKFQASRATWWNLSRKQNQHKKQGTIFLKLQLFVIVVLMVFLSH